MTRRKVQPPVLAKTKVKLKKWYFLHSHRVRSSRVSKFALGLPKWARYGASGAVLAVAAFVIFGLPLFTSATPRTLAINRTDLLEGTTDYGEVNMSNNGQALQLQAGLVGRWDPSANPAVQNVPALVDGVVNVEYGPNGRVFMMSPFDRQCTFSYYEPSTERWQRLRTPPATCGNGTILRYDGDSSMYFLPGGPINSPSDKFYRYNIATDDWTVLASFPSSVSNISSGTVVTQGARKYIYVFRGMSSPSFWRYDLTSNTWSTLPSFPTSNNVSSGVAVVWDGGSGIYAIGNATGEFKRFDLVTNIWTNLQAAPSPTNKRYNLINENGRVTALQLDWGNERTSVLRYNVTANSWATISQTPTSNNYDAPLPFTYDGSRYGYAVMGAEIRGEMYRFDFQTGTWDTSTLINSNSDNTQYHQALMHDNVNSIFFAGGLWSSNTDKLYRKDLTDGSVTQIGAQFQSSSGFAGLHYQNALYMLANGSSDFYKFDLATNAYVQLASLSTTPSDGLSLVSGGDGFLYLAYGNSRNTFQRYNVSTNSWSTLASSPQVLNAGGGTARIGQYIYAIAGNGSSYFMRYDMNTNVWSTLPALPNGSVSHGGFITGDSTRYLYISPNNRTESTAKKVYRYDTTNGAWDRIADMPGYAKVRASAVYNTSTNSLYVAQGQASPVLMKWNPIGTSYTTAGTWYSKTYDLSQVQTWTSLTRTVSGAGTATFYTRTSANGNIWSNWQQTSGDSIQSPTNRYFQFRVDLSGNGSATPTVSNISLQYDQETTAPSLPSQLTARGEKDSASEALVSGQSYEYQHPYFEWSGASDGVNGSGVDGYYVYFGTESGADPLTQGSYQTTTNYTVSTPMVAGEVYYLRIKVKDRLGNTSAAATYFSYRYFYISPPASIIKSTTADFAAGANTSLTIANNTMTLRKQESGAWATGPLTMLPDNASGATMHTIGTSVYVARGAGSNVFWRYDTETQSWFNLAPVPSNVSNGSTMTYDNQGNLYLIAGGNTTGFYRYNIENNIWTSVGTGVLPASAQNGTDIAYIGNNRFLILFTGVREFYEYSTVTNTYGPLSSYPTTISNGGSGVWYDGNDTLYAYLGAWTWDNARSSRNAMAKYTISTDSWRTLADPPVISYNTQNNLVYDGKGGLYTFANTQYNNAGTNQRMMRYDIESDSWHEVRGLFAEMFNGTATSDGERYFYLIPSGSGANSRKMIRYDTWNNQFTPAVTSIEPLDRIPYDVNNAWQWLGQNAATATYDGAKYIYSISGAEGTSSWSRFVKFDHKTGETIYLPPPPTIGIGGSMEYMNGYVYYLSGATTREFYRFDEPGGKWVRMADPPTTVYRPGPSTLVAVGGSLYSLRGNNNAFFRYSPDATIGSWTTLGTAPGTVLNGSAVYDTATNAIYVIAGNNTRNFYRYSLTTNSWTTLALLPANTTYGSTMVIQAGKIYAQQGNATKTGYVYTIASNTWADGTESPETFRYGATNLRISENYSIALPGEGAPDFWQFNFPTETTAYNGQATHISQPFEATGIFDYAGVSAQVDIPNNTFVELWTRTSDNGENWNEWKIATDIKKFPTSISGNSQSEAKRYTQVKVVLGSNDNMFTPTVRSYAVHYYFDIDPPQNPSVLNSYSDSSKTTLLSTNVWYNHSKPMFDWPDAGEPGGPTDGPLGSNIAGYWIYVGTDPTASPRTQGVFVPNSEYSPTLSIPGIYFVRMQTQDITGNVDGNIFAPFSYRFDNEPPTNPAFITVTPSGFTTQNNFTFTWPNSSDQNSGIAGYCYYTGANSGPFAVETCQAGTSLADVSAAYRTGTNVFYLRSYDAAGNYSPSYTTVSYYYATDPPGPPTNFRAIPPTSTQNMFAFAWDLPLTFSGDPSRLSYCYSINVLPSPTNTVCTYDRFIAPFKAATQQGTNVIYMVAKDEALNANWNYFATANFIANTISPGIPLNLIAIDTSDRVTNRWSITLTWDQPTAVGNGIASYVVERSLDGHTFTTVGTTSNRAYVDLDIQADSLYYYRVRAQDGVNNVGGASAIVSRTAQGYFTEPPQIVVAPSVSSDFDQARVNWTTSRESTSFVYYGTAPNNLTQSKGSLDPVVNHSQVLTGLQPSTTYYYRVQSFDERRNYNLNDAYSNIGSFRTSSAAQIERVSVTDITASSAVISWETSIPTKSRISYGTSTDYGLEHSNDNEEYNTQHTQRVTGLSSGSTYHFKVKSQTSFGSQFESDDYTFNTIARPEISSIRFQPLDDGATAGVVVSWKTNVPTSSTVYYAANGSRLEETSSEMVTDHEITLTSLSSNTEYAISIEGRDQYGSLASSQLQRWTSSLDTRAPKVLEPAYKVTTTNAGKGKRAQMIVSWKTDEPATSQVLFDTGTSTELKNESSLNTQPTTNHVVILSGLNLADIYKVQIVTRDLDGNTTRGITTTVVTPDREVSIFDNVLDLLVRIFSF